MLQRLSADVISGVIGLQLIFSLYVIPGYNFFSLPSGVNIKIPNVKSKLSVLYTLTFSPLSHFITVQFRTFAFYNF